MVFRKTIVQVYSGNEPFGFDDFVRGTLRLLNYAIDHNIDVKINISGSEFEQYMIVSNYEYNTNRIKPKIYYMNVDNQALIQDLDAFMKTSDSIFVVTSNMWLDRTDIYNLSYVKFDTMVRYKETLYQLAEQKVRDNLLYRPQSDNLLYGYSIIYAQRDEACYNITTRQVSSLAIQIRQNLDMNKDMMVFSNSMSFRNILSQYIEMNSGAIQGVDDSDIDISSTDIIPTVHDLLIDFIILLKAKKIYRFIYGKIERSHNIKFIESLHKEQYLNVYEAAFDINSIIGNLETTLIPLYYETHTLVNNDILDRPTGVAIDSSGNLYIADTYNHLIRKLDTSGNLSIYAGTGISGYTNGEPHVAQFNQPTAIAVDMRGNLYVADTQNHAIRIIERNNVYDSSGNIISINRLVGTLVGGNIPMPLGIYNSAYSEYTISSGSNSGSAVLLNEPRGVAVDTNGSVYISDTGNHRICKITAGGKLETIAGCVLAVVNGYSIYRSGYLNGNKTEASFNFPRGLCVDLKGNVFVADTQNNAIRRITPNGKVSTVAGNGQPIFKEGRRDQAGFNHPVGICVDLYNVLYVADTENNLIRRITNEGNVIPVVGSPNQKSGSIDGYGAIDPIKAQVPFSKRATFNLPSAICVTSDRKLYVADTSNNSLRKINPTFSTPIDIKPVAIQNIKVTRSSGVANTLGPTLSAPIPPPNTVIYGRQRGSRR
jgi:sugar lactone lactonase YvrE